MRVNQGEERQSAPKPPTEVVDVDMDEFEDPSLPYGGIPDEAMEPANLDTLKEKLLMGMRLCPWKRTDIRWLWIQFQISPIEFPGA